MKEKIKIAVATIAGTFWFWMNLLYWVDHPEQFIQTTSWAQGLLQWYGQP